VDLTQTDDESESSDDEGSSDREFIDDDMLSTDDEGPSDLTPGELVVRMSKPELEQLLSRLVSEASYVRRELRIRTMVLAAALPKPKPFDQSASNAEFDAAVTQCLELNSAVSQSQM